MSHGQTWSTEEIGALMYIWKDDYINEQLMVTQKTVHCSGYSAREWRRLDTWTCCTKVKIRQSGSAGDEKDDFTWYDDLNMIVIALYTCLPVLLILQMPDPDKLYLVVIGD